MDNDTTLKGREGKTDLSYDSYGRFVSLALGNSRNGKADSPYDSYGESVGMFLNLLFLRFMTLCKAYTSLSKPVSRDRNKHCEIQRWRQI